MQRLNYEVNAHRTSRLWILAISSWILLGAAGADDSKSTDDWLRQLEREDAGARISAAGALGGLSKFEAKRIAPALLRALKKEEDKKVRKAVIASLGKLGSEASAAVPDLMEALKDSETRDAAVVALGEVGPEAKAAIPALAELLADEPAAAKSLAGIGGDSIGVLVDAQKAEEPTVRARSASFRARPSPRLLRARILALANRQGWPLPSPASRRR
jgi:HEAT repeat protein